MNSLHSESKTMMRILFIEDDLAYAKLVSILLEESNLIDCELVNAPTLKEGIEKLQNNDDFAAILLDLTLPDSAGFATLETMVNKYPQKNIIVLTGAKDEKLGIKAVQGGAQDYLVKGEFDDRQLSKILRYSIERNHIHSRLEEAQRIAKIGHWECAPDDDFFTASKGVYHTFGVENIERNLSYTDIKNPSSPFYSIFQIIEETIKRKKVNKEERIRLPNNNTRFITMTCEADFNLEGMYSFTGIIQDITAQKRAEELRNSRDMAQQSAKIKEQVFANVSHEMRTPMNAIQGMVNLLFQTELNEEQQEYADSIKTSSNVLLGIINDVLEISAIQNEKIYFEESEFSLAKVLAAVVKTFEPQVQEKELIMELTVAPEIEWEIRGDKLKLNQILLNLVGNAVKFTDKGKVTITVEVVENGHDFAKIRFVIKDTGIGISPEQQSLIFEAFTRVLSNTRNDEGTGLGLSIAKKLIERQGGNISLQSEEGEGSVFSFELTFGKGELNQKDKDSKRKAPTVSENERIFDVLIVEDHKLNQLVMQKTLEKHWGKVNVAVANNGNEAIASLEKKPVDIILMDIQMPVRNGFDTTEYIRKKMPENIAKTPILAMTAWQYGSSPDEYKKMGFDDYILKPFDPDNLFQKIEYFLDKA